MIAASNLSNKPRRLKITITIEVFAVEPGPLQAEVDDRLRGYFRAMIGTWPNDDDFERRRERRRVGGRS